MTKAISDKEMGIIEYKGYRGTVTYNKEINEFNGKVLHTQYVLIYVGETYEQLVEMFKEVIDDYINSLIEEDFC